MKIVAAVLSAVLFFAGCGKDREVDIATPEQIEEKDMLIILPSVPRVFCYADLMAEIEGELADEFNLTNPQSLSVDANVDCSSYGYRNCVWIDVGVGENNKPQSFMMCLSDSERQICLYLMGNEYRDVEGNTFDETCLQGFDRNKNQ